MNYFKSSTSFLLFALMTFSLSAQNLNIDQSFIEKYTHKEALKSILVNFDQVMESFDVCGESFSWDADAQQFVYSGETLMEFVDEGADKTITITIKTVDEDGTNYVRLVNFYSFQQLNLNNFFFGDSSHVYFAEEQGDFQLLSRTLHFYEDEKVVFTEDYFDYSSFGLPLGMMKTGETRYYYEGDHLIAQASDALDFNTFTIEFSDSIIYSNNAMGLPIQEIGYEADFFSGEIGPYYKTEYSYINTYYVSQEDGYSWDGADWFQNYRYTNEYDGQNRRTSYLSEYTDDNGQSFYPTDRTLASYEETLPFDLPTSELTQDYENEAWVNSDLNTYENCIIENTDELIFNFEAWVDHNTLYLSGLDSGNDLQLAIYSMEGKKMKILNGSQFFDKVDVSDLQPGIYIIHIKKDGYLGSRKVIKVH